MDYGFDTVKCLDEVGFLMRVVLATAAAAASRSENHPNSCYAMEVAGLHSRTMTHVNHLC